MSIVTEKIKPTKILAVGNGDDFRQWFISQAKQIQLPDGTEPVYFLAHTDDGVIWGIVKGDTFKLAGDVFQKVAIPLHQDILQQARLFNGVGELLLWRTAAGFEYRVIADGASGGAETIEETQVLWGDKGKTDGAFTFMSEGRQGLHHAPPLSDYQPGHSPLLTVRHYIEYDVEGQAYIGLSRLVDLSWSERSRK